jgi:hypothetical protein
MHLLRYRLCTNMSQDVGGGAVVLYKAPHSDVLSVVLRENLVNKRGTNEFGVPIKTVDGQRFNRS